MRSLVLLLPILGALSLSSCSDPLPMRGPPPYPPAGGPESTLPDRLVLMQKTFADLPGWTNDTIADVLPALTLSCDRITKLPFDRSIGPDGMGGTAADWYSPCSAAQRLPTGNDSAARQFFEEWFTPYLVTNNNRAEGLFTGYFEPELLASRQKTPRFSVPIMGRPKDLVIQDKAGQDKQTGRIENGKLVPYFTRAEIESGAVGKNATVLAWVEDPVDAHILHIQGSGHLRFEDGSIQRIGVAATNGHPFVGIGKILRDRGYLTTDTTMPAIRAWLKAHPGEASRLMAENPRYVFYKPIYGNGPVGAEGVPLTSERSLAVDLRFLPLGMPLWLDTQNPRGQPLRRLMVAQDTGAAIKGPVRGDFFWGSGETAFDMAGRMKSVGRYWVLLPSQRSPRVAANVLR